MPIELMWDDDEHSIIIARFIADWTWVQYHEADRQLLQMAAGVNHRIDLINDLTKSNGLPEGNLLANIARGQNVEIPNLGIVVAIQLPRIVEALRPIAKQITRRDNRFTAQSLEEAYAIIAESREVAKLDTQND